MSTTTLSRRPERADPDSYLPEVESYFARRERCRKCDAMLWALYNLPLALVGITTRGREIGNLARIPFLCPRRRSRRNACSHRQTRHAILQRTIDRVVHCDAAPNSRHSTLGPMHRRVAEPSDRF